MAESKKRTFKVKTDRVNYEINFKSKSITKANDLTKVASVLVAEQIGLNKRDYKEKTKIHGNAEVKEI